MHGFNCVNRTLATISAATERNCSARGSACIPLLANGCSILLRRHPSEFLLLGIAVLTFVIITAAVWLLTAASTPLVLVLLSMLVLLLPGSQAAVQVMNYLTTNLLPVDSLSKLDFSEGIPDDCMTLVAIPTLLLNEKQVRGLVEKLEVRFLGNHDPICILRSFPICRIRRNLRRRIMI